MSSYCIPQEEYDFSKHNLVGGPYDSPEDCNSNCGSSTTECPPGYQKVSRPFRYFEGNFGDLISAQEEVCVKKCDPPCDGGKCCLPDGVDIQGNPIYSCQNCDDSSCCKAGYKIRINNDQVGDTLSDDQCVKCDPGRLFEVVDGVCQCTSCNCDFFVTQSEACKTWCCEEAGAEERPQECNCVPPTLVCTGGKEPNSSTPPCECICPWDKVWACDQECKPKCPSGKSYVLVNNDNVFDEDCVCLCDNRANCKAPKVLNDACDCNCPVVNGVQTLWSCDKDCLPPCPEGKVRVLDENGDCVCSDECTEDKPVKCTPDGGAESCYEKCDTGNTKRDGECKCCEQGEITCIDAVTGKKICDDPCNDAEGWAQIGGFCDCLKCETGINGRTNEKVGPGNQVLCNGKCVNKCNYNELLGSNCTCIIKCKNSHGFPNPCYKYKNGQCVPSDANGNDVPGNCQIWEYWGMENGVCMCKPYPCPPDANGNVPDRDPITGECPGQNGPPVGPNGPRPSPPPPPPPQPEWPDCSRVTCTEELYLDPTDCSCRCIPVSCPPNSSQGGDCMCYCNSPSATNIAGSCACSPGYVFGSDGVTCVPQGSWVGFSEKTVHTEKPNGYNCDANFGCVPVYFFNGSYETLDQCQESCQLHYSCTYEGCKQDKEFTKYGYTEKQCEILCKESFYCENNDCVSVFSDKYYWHENKEKCEKECM